VAAVSGTGANIPTTRVVPAAEAIDDNPSTNPVALLAAASASSAAGTSQAYIDASGNTTSCASPEPEVAVSTSSSIRCRFFSTSAPAANCATATSSRPSGFTNLEGDDTFPLLTAR